MEGQGPKSKGKTKGKPKLVAIASLSVAIASTSAPPPTPDTYVGDLSCALTKILSANGSFASILDSGTSSHLLKDCDVFWMYETTQAWLMRTANQGVLQTKGSGECLVHFTHKGVTTTVKLHDCLYAPSMCINLLSVGRMMSAGSKVGCTMGDGKFTIVRKTSDGLHESIYEGRQSNSLYFVDSNSFILLADVSLRPLSSLKWLRRWIFGTTAWAILGRLRRRAFFDPLRVLCSPPVTSIPNANRASLANILICPISRPPLKRPLSCWNSSFVIFVVPSQS